MVRRKPVLPPPLAAGTYRATCREADRLSADESAHSSVYPEAVCVSDGQWCTFFRDGVKVWSCNANYAAARFIMEATTNDHAS